MKAIIFVGLPASGKTTCYMKHLYNSHVRISLDLLKTRNKEQVFLDTCIRTQMPVVIDNTNVTAEERLRFIEPLQKAFYNIQAVYFPIDPKEAVRRNQLREGSHRVPDVAIYSKVNALVPPDMSEGFSKILIYNQITRGLDEMP